MKKSLIKQHSNLNRADLFKKIISKSSDLLAYYSADYKILAANPAFAKAHNLTPEEIMGKRIEAVFSGDLKDKILINLEKCLAGEHVVYESFYNYPGLGEKHIQVSYEPDIDPENEIIVGAIANINDITNLKHKEEQLQQKTNELAESNYQLTQFAHTIAHDLKQPLRTIGGFIKILSDKLNVTESDDDDLKTMMSFVKESTGRMSGLIDSLLNYSKSGCAGNKESINLNKTIEEVLSDLGHQIRSTKATIDVKELPSIEINPFEARVLFQNIISNSLKYIQEGKIPKIEIGSKTYNERYHIYIKDNGIGIDKTDFEKIFQLLFRIETLQSYEGCGIGLATCKKIIDSMGGKIWLESEPNEGTTFWLSFKKTLVRS